MIVNVMGLLDPIDERHNLLLVDSSGGMGMDFSRRDIPSFCVRGFANGLFGLMATFADRHQAIKLLDIGISKTRAFSHLGVPFTGSRETRLLPVVDYR